MRFPGTPTSVKLYHLPTTAGSTQSYPSTADLTVDGCFLPLDRKEHALEGGDLVDAYELYLAPDIGVRVGDKAVIAIDGTNVNFYVKKTFVANFGGLPHKRVSLSRNSHA